MYFRLLLGNENFCAAHVRPQNFRYSDGTVSLKMILKQSNQHSGRCDNRVVEGVRKIHLAVLAFNAHLKSA